jgi:branched-chain amino acid transport system permease protein
MPSGTHRKRAAGATADRSTPSLAARLAADPKTFYCVPVLALFVPLLTNPYTQFVVNLMLVYVLVAVGFNILIGNLGQLAFTSTTCFGIGAYAMGILMAQTGLPFWSGLIVAGTMGGLAGLLASVTALRGIRLYYLAIITLAFGELMRWVYIHADTITRGTDGLPLPEVTIFGLSINSEIRRYYLFLAIVVIVVKSTSNLLRSRIGRALAAIKDNELATASLGIATAWYIVLAFVWSGAVVGIAGGTFAVLIGRVVPDSFDLTELIFHFAMVMIGGVGNLAGSVLGAVALTALPEFFRSLPGLEEMLFGALLVLILLFRPNGLASFLGGFLPMFQQRFYRGER